MSKTKSKAKEPETVTDWPPESPTKTEVLPIDPTVDPSNMTVAIPPPAPPAHPRELRRHVSSAVLAFGEVTAALDVAYEQAMGEVTDETEVLEAYQGLALQDALEALARYRTSLAAFESGLKAEADRIAAARAKLESKRAWVDSEIRRAMTAAGVERAVAGPFSISLWKMPPYVFAEPSIDTARLPDDLVRIVPPVEARREIDKAAVARALKNKDRAPEVRRLGFDLRSKDHRVVIE